MLTHLVSRDLLRRHRATHSPGLTQPGERPTKAGRTAKACHQCIQAKAKCSNVRPCERCQNRGETCGVQVMPTEPIPSDSVTTSTSLFDNHPNNHATVPLPALEHQGYIAPILNSEAAGVVDSTFQDEGTLLGKHWGLGSAPIAGPFAVIPPIFGWNSTSWDSSASVFDPTLISNDYGFSIDDDALMVASQDWGSLVESGWVREAQVLGSDSSQPSETTTSTECSVRSRILSGHEIFKKSPWVCDPDPEDSAFTEEAPQLSEAEERRILPRNNASRNTGGLRLSELSCSSSKRDALLLLAQRHSGSGVIVRSFPSANILSLLLRNFVVREESSRCPFIHLPTLTPENCRIELLSAMIVSGSTTSASPEIWKFGLALQERTRLALFTALCLDNTIARHLDILQATILWQEAGSWSGSRRKMEVAESTAGNAPTVRTSSSTVTA